MKCSGNRGFALETVTSFNPNTVFHAFSETVVRVSPMCQVMEALGEESDEVRGIEGLSAATPVHTSVSRGYRT